MEPYIQISFLNDFIFCPRSIYFHQLYGRVEQNLYKEEVQIRGEAAHETIENKNYNSRKTILQGVEVFSEKYNLCGKIDLFDTCSGKLTERKAEIKTIYDGYIFQLFAQCHALREMGHEVNIIALHDLKHNRNFPIKLPEEDLEMQNEFENLIKKINSFDLFSKEFVQSNAEKCKKCIYSTLCDITLC